MKQNHILLIFILVSAWQAAATPRDNEPRNISKAARPASSLITNIASASDAPVSSLEILDTLQVGGKATFDCSVVVHDQVVKDDLLVKNNTKTKVLSAKKIRAKDVQTDHMHVFGDEEICGDLYVDGFISASSIDVLDTLTVAILDAGTISTGDILASDLEITGDALIGGNTTTNSLNVTTDAVINGTTTTTDLTVLDDQTVEGDLGVDGSISSCDVIVGCNILMNNSTSPLIGNVLKADLPFLHNSGPYNTFLGASSGSFTVTGNDNTGVGQLALTALTSGQRNTAVGSNALAVVTDGIRNTAIGDYALAQTTGGQNIAIGDGAGILLTTGANNIYLGHPGFTGNESGTIRIGTGNESITQTFVEGIYGSAPSLPAVNVVYIDANGQLGNVSNSSDTSIGQQAMPTTRPGNFNTAAGYLALGNNVNGTNNVAVGAYTLLGNSSGSTNVAVGANTLIDNTIGNGNVAVGASSMGANTSGSSNVAIGSSTLYSNTSGIDNVAIGSAVLFQNNGDENVGIGFVALNNNTTGSDNVAVGSYSLTNNTSGNGNIALGLAAMNGNSTGNDNIAIGTSAGHSWTIGSNNIALANNGVAGESNVMRLGTNSIQLQTFIAGIYGVTVASGSTVLINPAGQLGTVVSSKRFKNNIEDIGTISSALMQLRPVRFNYKTDETNEVNYGFIAEEVAQIYPELVVNDADGNPYTIKYHLLYALLLNEIQKNNVALQNDRADIEILQQAVQDLLARIVALESITNN